MRFFPSNRNRRVKIAAKTMGGKLGRMPLVPSDLWMGEVNSGDLFSKGELKSNHHPPWLAIRHGP